MLEANNINLDTLELISRMKITEQGLIIPKEWLANMSEVEIRQAKNALLIVPVVDEDPILQLGADPITEDIRDASIKHDHYLYTS